METETAKGFERLKNNVADEQTPTNQRDTEHLPYKGQGPEGPKTYTLFQPRTKHKTKQKNPTSLKGLVHRRVAGPMHPRGPRYRRVQVTPPPPRELPLVPQKQTFQTPQLMPQKVELSSSLAL